MIKVAILENDYAAYIQTQDGEIPIRDLGALRTNQGAENSGKVMVVGLDGNIFPGEEGNDLEKYIENYYALRRTGKVYQTKLWKFLSNPSSAGEKQLDNTGLAFAPSTDVSEAEDDYLNGQNHLFEWVHVNYIRDSDGTPRPIAIDRNDG